MSLMVFGIQHGDVREISFLEQAAIEQTFALGGKGSHLPHALLYRQQMQVANVMPRKRGIVPNARG